MSEVRLREYVSSPCPYFFFPHLHPSFSSVFLSKSSVTLTVSKATSRRKPSTSFVVGYSVAMLCVQTLKNTRHRNAHVASHPSHVTGTNPKP